MLNATSFSRDFSVRRFRRFLIVGAFNSAAGYGVFAGLLLVGLMPEAALLVATVFGVLFNFATTRRFVFFDRDNSRIPQFVVVYVVIYVLNALALRYATYLGITPWLAQLLLVPSAAVATFFALRTFVFKEKSL
jgi:putative flippase GtrA